MIPANVIKALDCCALKQDCTECPQSIARYGDCENQIKVDALALINRQKAEIDRYLHSIKLLEKDVADAREELKQFKSMYVDKVAAMGIKAFAERLKETRYTHSDICGYQSTVIDVASVDNLVKEMTEGGEINESKN